jgi:hypothetical protein
VHNPGWIHPFPSNCALFLLCSCKIRDRVPCRAAICQNGNGSQGRSLGDTLGRRCEHIAQCKHERLQGSVSFVIITGDLVSGPPRNANTSVLATKQVRRGVTLQHGQPSGCVVAASGIVTVSKDKVKLNILAGHSTQQVPIVVVNTLYIQLGGDGRVGLLALVNANLKGAHGVLLGAAELSSAQKLGLKGDARVLARVLGRGSFATATLASKV